MKMAFPHAKEKWNNGFTLAEILIALAISSIVLITITFLFRTQQDNYQIQSQVAEMQQNLRVAMFAMQREMRMIGMDPNNTGLFAGVTDVQTRNENDVPTIGGFSAITFTGDFGGGPGGAPNGIKEANETVTYRIYDYINNDSNFDLGRKAGAGAIGAVAENIESLGLAFAFDTDNNGLPETYIVGGVPRIIWAVDTNNDNQLDTNLDTNGDGLIDANDAAGPGVNGLIGGTALAAPIPMSQIYAVRIWMLARSNERTLGFIDMDTYAVGRQIIAPQAIADEVNNGGFRRYLLDTSVVIRNKAL